MNFIDFFIRPCFVRENGFYRYVLRPCIVRENGFYESMITPCLSHYSASHRCINPLPHNPNFNDLEKESF